jgi:voltage-gated potassium channel
MLTSTSALTPAGERWVTATARPLDVLALVFLVDVVLVWSFPDAPAPFLKALDLIAWAVWAGFAVDYVARLFLSTPRRSFVATHKLDLLMVLLPMLRILRVFLLLRKSLASISTEKIAGSIVSIVVAVVFGAAFLVWRIEYDAPGATITTFRTAIWWAVVTTTTVGYGDYTPVTPGGRGIAMLLMIVGIGLIGTISATIASFFVNRSPDGDDPDASPDTAPAAAQSAPGAIPPDAHAELLARLDALSAQQDEIRALLHTRDARPPEPSTVA